MIPPNLQTDLRHPKSRRPRMMKPIVLARQTR